MDNRRSEVLALLVGRVWRSGRELKRLLGMDRIADSVRFYRMMATLEDEGMIEGWYGEIEIGGQRVAERRYRIAPAGDGGAAAKFPSPRETVRS